ncbi:hypothetical protein F5Y16DRAFT_417104 [Xylariaceae sp. FL0255]|nr:hypothetical protein F5Y16DRAFT_417104 [Xylariaceae sp. FL0255]
MSLLLAPYTHAMRLGQGFNSYTQQICVDDAVVVDDQRPENVVTNDGTTMRIMAQKSATPSAWTRQKEVITSNPATIVLEENARKAKADVELVANIAADEPVEQAPAEADPESANVPTSESGEENAEAEPEVPAEAESAAVVEAEPEAPAEESTAEETGSVDEIADAEEARTASETPASDSPVTETPVADEGEPQQAQKGVTRPGMKSTVSKAPKKLSFGQSKGNTSKTPKRLASAHSKIDALKALTAKPTQPKGDYGAGNQEAIIENLQANASTDDKVDRDAIATNLRANTQSPSTNEQKKKIVKRSSSSDRGREHAAKAPATLDRAAIRSALTGRPAQNSEKAAKEEAEQARLLKEEAENLAEQRKHQRQIQEQERLDEAERRKEEREEARLIRSEKRDWDRKRREDARKAIENAANLKATSLADLEKIRAQNQFVERFNGMSEQTQKYDFDPTAPRGPSQTVTYTSRFVDRLSDVMDDMSVSGSLSIKAGKVGGSGKGSFVDSDKFKESDLNFYISVKVVNQTINFKDALVFNPLRSVDENNFREVYGDSFISGFIEGGEFNAIVSMKILNKAKKTDIQAEAKIALTAGAVQIEAEANVGIARSNIETNTETTIQVFWSGGGHIKPMEQQWDIQSLMAAAARFPDLVADCPQRTYAILTKYDSLRSFVARKPASYTPLQYENAQIYTNTLLDSFVSYKALYKRLGEQIFGVQNKTLEVIQWSDTEKAQVATTSTAVSRMGSKDKNTGLYPYVERDAKFEASIKGLSDARTAIRRQMARIVNEVDAIEKDPKLATDEDHTEPYQSPIAFEARIPVIEVPERLRVKSHPLSGRRIAAKQLTEEEQKAQLEKEENEAAGIKDLYTADDKLEQDEKTAFDSLLATNPYLGSDFQISSAVGETTKGELFNNLEFLKPEWHIRAIRTEMFNGALVYLAISYSNGLLVERGASRDKTRIKKFGPFLPGERINSVSIEHGKEKAPEPVEEDGKKKMAAMMPTQILGLRLFTNRGRALIARALKSAPGEKGIVVKDGVTYESVNVLYIDVPFPMGTLKGFFGRSDDEGDGKIFRLGVIWGSLPETTGDEAEAEFLDTSDTVDSEDLALMSTSNNRSLQEMQQKLAAAQKALEDKEEALNQELRRVAKVGAETERTYVEQLKDASRRIEDKERQITELQNSAAPKGGAQCGSFMARDRGWAGGEECRARISEVFARKYAEPPKLLFGLSVIDAEANRNRCMGVEFPSVQNDGFSLQAVAWNGTFGHAIGCHWMTLPTDLHLETGMIDTWNTREGNTDRIRREIFFSQSFKSPPKVCVWLQLFEWTGDNFMSIKCSATDISPNAFVFQVESWAGRRFSNVRVQYLAYPSEEDGKRVKSGTTGVNRGQGRVDQHCPFYGEPFKTDPAAFIAICETDFNRSRNTRFSANAVADRNSLKWDCGTWADTDMDHAVVQWIAIE